MRVDVLGSLEITGDDGRPLPLDGTPARQLLAWLALHEEPSPRARVAGALWPRLRCASARRNLRHAVFTLRAAVGPRVVEATRTTLALAADVETDVRDFERLAAAGEWEPAVALVRGHAAADLDGAWLEDVRDRRRQELAMAMRRLALQAESREDARGAIEWTRRLLQLDPFDEDATRRLMLLLAGSGDRAGALAAYCRLTHRLMRQFAAAPSAETRRLAVAVRGPTPAAQRASAAGSEDRLGAGPASPVSDCS